MKSRMAVLTFLMVGLLLWVGALAAAPVEANGGPVAGSLEEPTGNNFEATTVDFQTIYVSTSGAGKMGALRYASADILAYDVATETWSLYFDGSDVGLTRNMNNFAIREFGTSMREGALQLCPELGIMLATPARTPSAKPASSSTMLGLLPPSSWVTRLTVGAAALATSTPARVDPVKDTMSTSLWPAMTWPTEGPSPLTML